VELFAGKKSSAARAVEEVEEKQKKKQKQHKQQVVACNTIELMALHCDGYLISDLLLRLWLFLLLLFGPFLCIPPAFFSCTRAQGRNSLGMIHWLAVRVSFPSSYHPQRRHKYQCERTCCYCEN
jgi:hypothetical protein